MIIENLFQAAKIADQIFWKQSAHDALECRNKFQNQPGPMKDYIEINYGPYDRLYNYERFVGDGSVIKPLGAGFYPQDLSREEFLMFVKHNPDKKDLFESQYTIIMRDQQGLKATYYTLNKSITKGLLCAFDMKNFIFKSCLFPFYSIKKCFCVDFSRKAVLNGTFYFSET